MKIKIENEKELVREFQKLVKDRSKLKVTKKFAIDPTQITDKLIMLLENKKLEKKEEFKAKIISKKNSILDTDIYFKFVVGNIDDKNIKLKFLGV